ncbi:MAG: hypothetical protein CMJ64_14855 [Planctomycetaceae bacterium]|nr:hypothetical protein [Planctomycetaceae bacterium]
MAHEPSEIARALDAYPRETLTRTPTPLDHLPHASAELGTELYLKRDDLTDLALGGDKPRKLEYELANARAEQASILVTCGSAQSNHARLTTAAAKHLGLKCAVVLSRDGPRELQGNLLTVQLMGADVHFIDTADHWELGEHALRLCDELRAQGENPYYIPVSGTTPLSCLGYIRAGLEIADQLEQRNLQLDAIYTPFGTGGIFTALLLALRERGVNCPIIGLSVNGDEAHCHENVEKWKSALCEMLFLDPAKRREPYEIYDEFIGKAYGDATEEALDAILMMAGTEGILLDPVYSGKVFAGLRFHCRAGRWAKDHRVMMVHSGGVPAVFAYHEQLSQHLRKRSIAQDERRDQR